MAIQVFANNVSLQVLNPILITDTSITLYPGQGSKIPALVGGNFARATINDFLGRIEIVRITAVAGDVITVTRAQEATTALAFDPGANVDLRITRDTLSDLQSPSATTITIDGTTLDQQFLSRVDRVVDSITALKALSKFTYTRVHVTGYYSAGDGGGGFYWYDSSDTTSIDNGGTIIVAIDGGRWKLIHLYEITVKQFGAKGDNVNDDTAAINACVTYCTANGIEIIIPGGPLKTYKTTSTLAWGIANIRVSFRGGASINPVFGAANPAVSFDAGSGSTNIYNATIKELFVNGSANVTDAVYIRGHHHVKFENLRGANFSGALVHTQFCIEGMFINPICSTNEQAMTTIPTNGFKLDQRNAGEYTDGITVDDAVIEGVSGYAIDCESAQNSTFTGGTFENGVSGVFTSTTSHRNRFVGIHMEANTAGDASINGNSNEFINCNSLSTAVTHNFEIITADSTLFLGGYIRCINLQSTSTNTDIISVRMSDNASLGIQGIGTYRNRGVIKTNTSGVITGSYPDFLEGTFVPLVGGSTGVGANTYSTQIGTYTRIGNQVWFSIFVVLTGLGTNTGNIIIQTLPFPSRTYTTVSFSEWDHVTLTANYTQLAGYISTGTSVITLTQNGSNQASAVIPIANLATNSGFIVSGCYLV